MTSGTYSLPDLASRAEKLHRKSGKATCMVCRNMIVESAYRAACSLPNQIAEIEVNEIGRLSSLTRKAMGCEHFESMVE